MIDIFDRKGFDCLISIDATTLKGVDLSGAELGNACLVEFDLSGANLKGVNLSSADLRLAKLDGADLSGANLKDADFTGCSLDGANLKGADIEGAKLTLEHRTALKEAGIPLTGLQLELGIKS